jgi:hypothetical protein
MVGASCFGEVPFNLAKSKKTFQFYISHGDGGGFREHGAVLYRTWDWRADPRLVWFRSFLPKPT